MECPVEIIHAFASFQVSTVGPQTDNIDLDFSLFSSGSPGKILGWYIKTDHEHILPQPYHHTHNIAYGISTGGVK
jgi:hypothetical protein